MFDKRRLAVLGFVSLILAWAIWSYIRGGTVANLFDLSASSAERIDALQKFFRNWGALSSPGLILSDNPYSYDQFQTSYTSKRFKFSMIITRLEDRLAASHVEVIDETAQHAGHAESLQVGGDHFSVLIVAEQFTGKTLVERHRAVYAVLQEELKAAIHALKIQALAPSEWSSRSK